MTDLRMIDTDYRRIGDTTLDVWEAELRRLGSPFLPQVAEIYEAARPHSALCLGMGVVENRWGATGHYIKPYHNNPMSLRPWAGDPQGLPPGATGIIETPDTGSFLQFGHPASCIREWKRRMTDAAYKHGVYVGARTLAEMIAIYAPAGDVHGGTGVDNADIGYASTVAILLRKYAEQEGDEDTSHPGDDTGGTTPPGGTPVAGMKPYTFVGAKGPVWLPDWIDVDIRIIEHYRFNSQTTFTGQKYTTWHDTGNPSTNAEAEYRWAAGGRQGGSVGGYSFIYDDTKIIQTQQLDRVTWAQGTSDGNRLSWAAEQAWGAGVNFGKSLEVGAALHGGLIAMMGWETDTALVQHRYWTGKWCPGQILNRGIWSQVVKMTGDAAREALLAARGTERIVYPAPVPIPELAAFAGKPESEIPYRVTLPDGTLCIYVADRVRAVNATPRMRYSEGSQRVGPKIPAGAEFDVDWLLLHEGRDDIYLSPWNTRVLVKDTQRISDVQSAA